ncbi:MAG: YihY/virulence factor BrkB family protein [Flavipsychrobacter sp.]|jgi:membrane protein|nr:YihY/virulence factor BrkB family protein [Flavipsychrobacter sp.]
MVAKFREYFSILKEATIDFIDDNAIKLSASLAYFTIFSIGPLLLVVITLVGFFYDQTHITNRIFDQMALLVGKTGTEQLKAILDNISKQNNTGLFGIIGGIVLVFGATGIFTEIQGSINYIWSIKAKPEKSWLKYLTDRLLSFSLIIGIGFLMLVTLFINILVDMLTKRLEFFIGSNVFIVQGINLLLLFASVTLLFTVIYKVLPDATIYWKDAMTGAAFTAVFFLIGKFLIGYYLGNSKALDAFGAAASIILLLSWVYYSALILYFGAEFTKVYSMKLGKGITVYKTAVYIVKREATEVPGVKHPTNIK